VHDAIPDDLRDFILICAEGRFYLELSSTIGLPYRTDREKRRVKREACKIIFGAQGDHPRSVAFHRRWPTIGAYLAELKVTDHRRVAWLSQTAEARLMIGRTCELLRRRNPTLPILTIHDSILIPSSAVDEACAAIEGAWGAFGAIPTLRLKLPA
jgi:hypothetical protein